jgi:hypothetical protein
MLKALEPLHVRMGVLAIRTVTCGLVGLFLSLAAIARPQALPPPRDGEIRVLYWELRGETEVWLTLDPRSPDGDELPITLSLSVVFSGKRPPRPLTQVDVRAFAGLLWAPTPELMLTVDGESVEFAPPGPSSIYSGSPGEGTLIGVVGTIAIATLKKMATARSIVGNALRMNFDLNGSQRAAIAKFAERVLSPDPGLLNGPR